MSESHQTIPLGCLIVGMPKKEVPLWKSTGMEDKGNGMIQLLQGKVCTQALPERPLSINKGLYIPRETAQDEKSSR